MIEPYAYVLDYGISPSCPIPPLVETGAVVGLEGSLIQQPTPVPQKDEVTGQNTPPHLNVQQRPGWNPARND